MMRSYSTSRVAFLGLLVMGCHDVLADDFLPLVPRDEPAVEWGEFEIPGYQTPVAGMIFDDDHLPNCGMAVGGLSTGALDLEVNGTIGFDTIFRGYPRKVQRFEPFLGMSVGGRTWVLATDEIITGGIVTGAYDPARDPYTGPRKWNVHTPGIAGVRPADSIRYFAHYPVVNYDFETDAPVRVGLRAWSPFVPGDAAASSVPAIVFEVRLENSTDTEQKVALALNYPGLQWGSEGGVRYTDAGIHGDAIWKKGMAPFDGKILPETEPQFARPNPGRSIGGRLTIGDPSRDGRNELVVGFRDVKTARGFLVTFQPPVGRAFMNGEGKGADGYPWEVIDKVEAGGFSSTAVGDVTGDRESDLVAGTLGGEIFLYERKTPGFAGGTAEPGALYRRTRLNPEQSDGGHVSEVRIGDVDGDGTADIVYALGYRGANAATVPGVYWISGGKVRAVTTSSTSEFLGLALGDYDANGRTEIALAMKSGDASKNGIEIHSYEDGSMGRRAIVARLGVDEGPQWLVTGDFDGNGRDDLLAGTLTRGTLWFQHAVGDTGWAEPEVVSAHDFTAYSDPVEAYAGEGRTLMAIGGQNTYVLGRIPSEAAPADSYITMTHKPAHWGFERWHLGPHQGKTGNELPAVAIGDLTGDGRVDVITWNVRGELTGLSHEGHPFFQRVPLEKTKTREIEPSLARAVVGLPHREEYAIAVLGQKGARFGGDLGKSKRGWADLGTRLPSPSDADSGLSVAVDFDLAAREKKIVRYVLAWYVPEWRSAFTYERVNMTRYRGAADIIDEMSERHGEYLNRISRWQQVVYGEAYPIWLKDALINSLLLIPEDSYWAVAKPPLGNWCFPDGLLGMLESPRAAPQIECIPCSWYGQIPILYFFPDLMRTTLRGYKEYQRPDDGAMVFNFGARDEMWWFGDHAVENQIALNGFCFVDMVYRHWMRTQDDTIVEEFYPAVKGATEFAIKARPEEYGMMHMPTFGSATEWWEGWAWKGLTTHAGSLNLASLLEAEKMAIVYGDDVFAKKCREWFDKGREVMETLLGTDQGYLLFRDVNSDQVADDIMANQFDAEWVTRFNGLESVFDQERFKIGLAAIERANVVDTGAAAFATREGKPLLRAYGNFIPEMFILGMTYMYAGNVELGAEICKRTLDNLYKRQLVAFDWPNWIYMDTGERAYGSDYHQNMIVWAIPAALEGQTIEEATGEGSLIDRIIDAAQRPERLRLDSGPIIRGVHDQVVPDYVPPTLGDVKEFGEDREEK